MHVIPAEILNGHDKILIDNIAYCRVHEKEWSFQDGGRAFSITINSDAMLSINILSCPYRKIWSTFYYDVQLLMRKGK
jgi:hypothetical protein